MSSVETPTKRLSQAIRPVFERHSLRVRKTDNLHTLDSIENQSVPITLTLCPLYAPGRLSESRLLAAPEGIKQSRVQAKWEVVQGVFQAVNNLSQAYRFRPLFEIYFADKGVIVADETTPVDELLDYHFSVYNQALKATFPEAGINFRRYSQLETTFTKTITPESTQESRAVEEIVDQFKKKGIHLRQDILQDGKIHPRGERIIRKLLSQVGDAQLGFELIKQYGLYDGLTAQPNGLNMYIERESAGLLLQITDIFEHSKYPRIDILC